MRFLIAMDVAARRLRQLHNILGTSHGNQSIILCIRRISDQTGSKKISIGDVSKLVTDPKSPELVPKRYLKKEISQTVLRHLRWIMQKDSLGQDIFLIGPPGPQRRQLAMMYLELTKRETEYVALSRDTTESDLKQRREIENGTASYIDQCAVKAALEGRILVLEGIEKVERNVLPVLNNLLENREMQLDDGRFLMAADRYDDLLKNHSQEEMDALRLVRVSKDFRVIALGLPIPRYQGNPLDPPLRSRFQGRDIHPLPFKELYTDLSNLAPNLPVERLSRLLSCATTLLQKETSSLGLPDFPIDNLKHLVEILNVFPNLADRDIFHRLYPYTAMLGREGKEAVEDALKKFEIKEAGSKSTKIKDVKVDGQTAAVVLKDGWTKSPIKVAAGTLNPGHTGLENAFFNTPYHETILSHLCQSHLTKDFCIIGPRGCGKSVVVRQFASLLGYNIEPILLYQDMTSRDLLQQRTTLPNGDTVWRPTPLITAALEGSLAVLDGVHRVNAGSFSVLHRLISERELQLFDGTRLIGKEKYDAIKEEMGYSNEEMLERGILPIHPSFRIIALSEPPVIGSPKQQWLSPEMLTMFLYHTMRPLSRSEEISVISSLVPKTPNLDRLFDFVHKLRESTDSTLQSVSFSLSTRQLLRIARRLSNYPSEDLHSVIYKACLARFLPRLAQSALNQRMEEASVYPVEKDHHLDSYEHSVTCEVKEGKVRIGDTSVPMYNPENLTKVPNILFYENPQHLTVMEDMLKDFTLGEHLLLVGNQGVGKNKIVDRFLQLLNRPREYVQLHRDTTVQTLTLQPTVKDGVIVYEDSPLVIAVKTGRVLVVDEADKAPTNVTCVLKTLVESGEMHLADGRRIVAANSVLEPRANIIKAHPDFRMIVLANRPGFPFLGNDFFGSLGDIFSCHAIDNPDTESELAMLRQYGPDVPEATLKRLVAAFADLRDMADQGLINYPYSTREVVSMVKHLQLYPNEGLTSVVKNVFDFDSYNKELQDTIVETMHKHGIPLGASQASISLATELPMPSFEAVGKWNVATQGTRTRTALMGIPVTSRQITLKGPVSLPVESKTLNRTESRAEVFTEQEAFSTLPLEEANVVCDVTVSKASQRSPGQDKLDVIHAATCRPICLYSLTPTSPTANLIDLYDVFPATIGTYRPRVKIQALAAPLDDSVLLHEEVTNVLILVNVENGEITRLMSEGLPETPPAQRRFATIAPQNKSPYVMCQNEDKDPRGTTLFYKMNGSEIEVLNILEGVSHSLALPFNIQACHPINSASWILIEANTNRKYVMNRTAEDEFSLSPITETDNFENDTVLHLGTTALSDEKLSQVLESKMSSPNRVSATNNSYASVYTGFPELSDVDVYAAPRTALPETSIHNRPDPIFGLKSKPAMLNKERTFAHLPESGQMVRALPTWQVPKEAKPDNAEKAEFSGYLEVSDIAQHKLRYIPIPGPKQISPYASWMFNTADCNVFIAPVSHDGLVSVDIGGSVRFWETVPARLETSLKQWRDMLGYEDQRPLQLNEERESGKNPEEADPKHGKEDPNNQPHVGGNTWAGGVGGSSTAGLGGFGGPYRLDMGHQVFQVPQWEKDAVPEHIKQAAREMGQKAYLQRLKEIQMSQYDGNLYEQYSASVRRQVQSLRVILDSLQAKGKERQWLKHQTYGELDDAKLIEGITGDSGIYKRRGEKEPEMGSPQEHPKRLRLVIDVSGSMYRFDGHDSRLTRQMEAILMLMEALETYEDKIKYDIYGHSGETYREEFVKVDKPPKNNKERLVVLKNILAHAQFCISGDHTLEAAKHHIDDLSKQEADEHFVVILSDANFDRYGIRPSRFGEILTGNEDVNAYAIFIGSLGDQAIRLNKQLPMGHSYVCLDTKNLPQILQQIFASTMLSS